MTEKMDNFTDDASPKAGVPTCEAEVAAARLPAEIELAGWFFRSGLGCGIVPIHLREIWATKMAQQLLSSGLLTGPAAPAGSDS